MRTICLPSALLATFLLAGVLLAYGPAYRAGFIWDDDDYVTQNTTLRTADGLGRIWFSPGATPQYYPATFTSFWIEYRLWGLHPVGYHAVNILLHAANALLLWRLLAALGLPGAWLAAMIFGLHPVHVESVAWITERKNTLSMLFYLLAALQYLKARPLGEAGAKQGPALRPYVLALVFFTLALFSKTTTCSLPAAILLATWWERGRVTRSDITPTLPFFALGLIGAWMTVHMEANHVRATGPDWDLSPLTRVLIASEAIWFYASKLVWPANLAFIYPRNVPDPSSWIAWWPVAAGLAFAGALWWQRQRTGRGPWMALLFFSGTLLPALGFINVYPMRYSFVADHFQYLASIGVIALIATALTRIAGAAQPARIAAAMLLAAVLGTLTWRQSRMYHDLETLWATTIERNPGAWMAHNNLGLLRHQAGRIAEATALYKAAHRIHPRAPEVLTNLGNVESEAGRWREAEHLHREALAANPNFSPAWYNLGNTLLEQGDLADAVAAYQQALRLKPNYPEALSNLAKARAQQGQSHVALDLYRQSLRIEGDNATTWNNIAFLHLQRREHRDALDAALQAVRLQSDLAPAHLNRALALVELGDQLEATAAFERAIEINPSSVTTWEAFAAFALRHRSAAEAESVHRRSLESVPAHAPLLYGLGLTLVSQNRRADAAHAFREAVAAQSNHVGALNNAAWLASTSDQSTPDEIAAAVRWAERAVQLTGRQQADPLSTLAASYAAAGRYEQAVAVTDEILQLEAVRSSESANERFKKRRALFASGRPLREE